MERKFYSTSIRLFMLALCVFAVSAASAQKKAWEQLCKIPASNAFHIASNGNFIIADYQWDLSGGIYVSEDRGTTWTKTNAPDYTYNVFCENEEYVFAAGCECRIARSDDGGKTWEVLSYKRAVEDALGEYADYSNAYALAIHNGKLFLGDFSGGGIIYSEDNGESWKQTDLESLSYGEVDPKLGKRNVENFYSLASYDGELYAFGVYFVFRYLPETNSWETIRTDSNFMGVNTVYQGKLCTGRSVMNYSFNVPFIETLDEEGVWGEIARPVDFSDNNIRAIYGADNHLFVGMAQSGVYYTPDAGTSWASISEGIPYSSGTNFTPMAIRTDKDYAYLLAYEPPYATTTNSGLFRLALTDLPDLTGIDCIKKSEEAASYNGNALTFAATAKQAAVYDLSGRQIPVSVSGNSINVEHLNPGTYLYKATVNGATLSGKFQKK